MPATGPSRGPPNETEAIGRQPAQDSMARDDINAILEQKLRVLQKEKEVSCQSFRIDVVTDLFVGVEYCKGKACGEARSSNCPNT